MRDTSSVLYKLKMYMIWTKRAHQSAIFKLSTVHVKIHQICTLIGSFCWKNIKLQVKKYRGVMSHSTEEWCPIWRKTGFFVSKMIRIWWVLTRTLENTKSLHFVWFLFCKVDNVWAKKIHRCYLSWLWRLMQNLKKNWLMVWKMTREIWWIFTIAIESLKIETLMRSFGPK